MLAVVKTSNTKFTMNGQVPEYFINEAIRLYGKENVSIDDEYINPFETDWYQSLEIDDSPGGNLRFYRKQAGLTQKELAKRLNIAPQFVSNMENNLKTISRKTAIELSSMFHVSVARFI